MKFYLLFFLFFFISYQRCSAQTVAVIANKSVPVQKISDIELLDLYSGDVKYWKNDKPVVVFDLEKSEQIRDKFYNFLGKSSSRMKSIWMKRLLSGEGQPPESIEDENAMIEKVATTKGAIGFIDNSLVDNRVKVIAKIK